MNWPEDGVQRAAFQARSPASCTPLLRLRYAQNDRALMTTDLEVTHDVKE